MKLTGTRIGKCLINLVFIYFVLDCTYVMYCLQCEKSQKALQFYNNIEIKWLVSATSTVLPFIIVKLSEKMLGINKLFFLSKHD